jgi:sulfide dehydrogenase cytochrome subunit
METRNIPATLCMGAVLAFGVVWNDSVADDRGVIEMCATCHGEDGVSQDPSYPSIAGIPAEVQEDALYAYRDGGRDCGDVPMMCKMASQLSDDEIAEYSAYFAEMTFRPAEQPFDADLAAKGKVLHDKNCLPCHGEGPDDAESSILHGQWADYLRYALSQYAAGEREQMPMMKKKIEKLTEQDIESLVNFYASYR